MALRGSFLALRIRESLLPPFAIYRAEVLDHLLPSLGDINRRAEEFRQAEYDRLLACSTTANDDISADLAETANEDGIAYGITLLGLRQGILNLTTAGMFHLLEQQLADLWNDAAVEEEDRPEAKLDVLADWMDKRTGIKLKDLAYWDDLTVLRAIANVAKHGRGRAAKELRKRRPQLLVNPELRRFLPGFDHDPVDDMLLQPLVGEGLYVTPEEFAAAGQLAERCLTDLANIFDGVADDEFPRPRPRAAPATRRRPRRVRLR